MISRAAQAISHHGHPSAKLGSSSSPPHNKPLGHGTTSLARRQEPQTGLQYRQTSTPTPQTLPNNSGTLARGLRDWITGPVEYPPSIPRLPPYDIPRNLGTQPKLHPTATGTNWSRGRIRGGGSPKPRTPRTPPKIAVPDQMERIPGV
jgi:hypothetical protein